MPVPVPLCTPAIAVGNKAGWEPVWRRRKLARTSSQSSSSSGEAMGIEEGVEAPDIVAAVENLKQLMAYSSPRTSDVGTGFVNDVLDSGELFKIFVKNDSIRLDPDFYSKFGGSGFMPWEIHRPQRAVRELVRRGEFKIGTSVLDVGCGIGDNALFLARYCKCHVTACDKVSRCLAFGRLKAQIRNMQQAVKWLEADALDAAALTTLGGPFDTILDSGMLICFTAAQRPKYLANLVSLVRPGGKLHIICIAETETRVGPQRLSQDELRHLFDEQAPGAGLELVSVEKTVYEQHPSAYQYDSYCATFLRPAAQHSTAVPHT